MLRDLTHTTQCAHRGACEICHLGGTALPVPSCRFTGVLPPWTRNVEALFACRLTVLKAARESSELDDLTHVHTGRCEVALLRSCLPPSPAPLTPQLTPQLFCFQLTPASQCR